MTGNALSCVENKEACCRSNGAESDAFREGFRLPNGLLSARRHENSTNSVAHDPPSGVWGSRDRTIPTRPPPSEFHVGGGRTTWMVFISQPREFFFLSCRTWIVRLLV